MSAHNIPLSDLERDGLIAHGLGRHIGKPSQAADIFRQGVNWALQTPEWRAKALQDRKEIDDLLSKPLHEVAGLRTDGHAPTDDSELITKAQQLVIQHQRASISLINRHLQVSYNTAARLMDALEKDGIVSPMNPTGHREVLKGPPP
jgi:DNA segregation ATPase FtsK/SpoIIIE-like protein